MNFISVQSQRFLIRTLSESDVNDEYVCWLNDDEVTRFLNSRGKRRTREDIVKYVVKHDNISSFHLGVFVKETKKHIGNYSIYCDFANSVAQINVLIGDRAWWKQGVVVETRAALLDFLFDELEIGKVCGTPYARNLAAVYNYQAQGFKLEGILRDHRVLHDGTRSDVLCFAMFRDDWHARKLSINSRQPADRGSSS